MIVMYRPVDDSDQAAVTARETELGIPKGIWPRVMANPAVVVIYAAGQDTIHIEEPTDAATVAAAVAQATASEAAYATAQNNAATLIAKGAAALNSNISYLALSPPTNAQVAAQVVALTRQVNVLIRLASNLLSTADGT